MTKEAVNKEILDIQLLPRAEQIAALAQVGGDGHRAAPAAGGLRPPLVGQGHAEPPGDHQGARVGRPHGARHGGDGPRGLRHAGGGRREGRAPQGPGRGRRTRTSRRSAWALVALKESSAFDTVMGEYRLGHLATVQRLDGYPAFDAEMLAALVPIDKIAALAGDESDSVRQLVATTLSKAPTRSGPTRSSSSCQDKQVEVAREAAVGLGKIGSDKATQPLVDALQQGRQVVAREVPPGAARRHRHQRPRARPQDGAEDDGREREVPDEADLRHDRASCEDPRGGDALYAYIQTNPKPHWKIEAAMRMAEIGDVRAAEVLGWRMKQDPLKLYNDVDWPELRRDDNERVYGGAHARRPRGHPPREARLPPRRRPSRASSTGSIRTTSRSRTRTACASSRRWARTKAIPMLEALGRPEGQAPERGRAAAVPRRRGRRRRARSATSAGRRTRRAVADPREAAPPPQPKLDVSWDSLHAGRPHHPRA